MRSTLFRILISFLMLAGCLLSCRHDSDLASAPVISFKNNVQAIIVGNCTQSGCHTGGSDAEFALVSFEDVASVVNPGNADNSNLFEAITGRSGRIMPPSPQPMLNDNQIKFIYLWIEQGAKNN